MCGIAGLIGKDTPVPKEHLDKMLSCIYHRGPDDAGEWHEDLVRLGHRRLSILDLSPAGRQPMLYWDRYVLVFNGEIYNYLELQEELKSKGYRFRSETDSEVIPAAYDCWGEECQQHMNGMWAFALYDRRARTLFCSRDRYGIKPFYYLETGACFAFGSEIKQLLPLLPGRPAADRTALELFLAAGYLDYSENTMFRDVRQLRGGCCLRYSLPEGRATARRWYAPAPALMKEAREADLISRFRELFREAVGRHLRADVEIGSCLSGGLDSSAIVCEINRRVRMERVDIKQHVISSCFEDQRFDEREYSHAVLRECANLVSSEVFPDMEELPEAMGKVVWHMDEPFASSSVFAQWEVYRCAHELGLKVMLDGQGADELLAGYPDFYKMQFCSLFRKGQWRQLWREIYGALSGSLNNQGAATARFFAVNVFEAVAPLRFQSLIFRIYQRTSPSRAWLRLSKEGMGTLCAVKRRFAKRDPQKFTRAFLETGLSELLHYEDRNAMAFSVEARVPFLDEEFAAFAEALPFSLKIREGKTKWIMREALRGGLPKEVISRRDKMGFVTPESRWLTDHRAQLRPLLRQAAETLSPLIDTKRLLRWYDGQNSFAPGDSRVWRILCAAEWVRVFNVQV